MPEDKKIYTAQTLTCKTCNEEFQFTVSEQKFFEEKGFYNPSTGQGKPIRCQKCRDAKKARNIEKEERITKQMPKAYQTDAEKDWVAAMLERWDEQVVLFGNKD